GPTLVASDASATRSKRSSDSLAWAVRLRACCSGRLPQLGADSLHRSHGVSVWLTRAPMLPPCRRSLSDRDASGSRRTHAEPPQTSTRRTMRSENHLVEVSHVLPHPT